MSCGAGAMVGCRRANGGTHARFRRCTQARDEMRSMAALYAQHSAIEQPIVILKRQMDALRALYSVRGRSGNMPSQGGWNELEPFRHVEGQKYEK